MRIYKILISTFFVLALLCSFAFADTIQLRINEVNGLVGDEIEVSIINQTDISGIAMLDLMLNFNDSKLTFTGSESAFLSESNINASNDEVKIVWVYSSDQMMSLGAMDTLATLKFIVEEGNKTGDFLPIVFNENSMVSDEDENLFDLNLVNGGINVTENSIQLTIPAIPVLEDGPVHVPVIINYGFEDVAMIELHIQFESGDLNYNSFASDYLVTNNVNVTDDIITILWVYSGPTMNIPDNDTLLIFNFDIDRADESTDFIPIVFTGENNVSDLNVNPFQLYYKDGGIFFREAEPTVHPVPGKIEAEDYSDMFGIQTETATDVGGGLNVGWIDDGDWLEYIIDVQQAELYDVEFRIAAPNSNGSVKFIVDGTEEFQLNIPSTGGWQTWETVSQSLNLSAGEQTIRILAETGGFNFNWLNIDYYTSIKDEQTVAEFRLYQNYPNPFNPSTTIQFSLMKKSVVKLDIYNLDGSLVKNLISRQLGSGLHTVDWHAENHPSGVYIYKIQTDNLTDYRKCVLMK